MDCPDRWVGATGLGLQGKWTPSQAGLVDRVKPQAHTAGMAGLAHLCRQLSDAINLLQESWEKDCCDSMRGMAGRLFCSAAQLPIAGMAKSLGRLQASMWYPPGEDSIFSLGLVTPLPCGSWLGPARDFAVRQDRHLGEPCPTTFSRQGLP